MLHVHIQAQTQLNGMHFQLSDLGRHFKFSGYIVDGLELHFKHDKCRPFVYPTSTTVMGGVAHGTHLCLYLNLHLYLYLLVFVFVFVFGFVFDKCRICCHHNCNERRGEACGAHLLPTAHNI